MPYSHSRSTVTSTIYTVFTPYTKTAFYEEDALRPYTDPHNLPRQYIHRSSNRRGPKFLAAPVPSACCKQGDYTWSWQLSAAARSSQGRARKIGSVKAGAGVNNGVSVRGVEGTVYCNASSSCSLSLLPLPATHTYPL